ncbi:class I SAM-dependent methyltransferase [Neobacillus sp. MM2021_6]|uniref:class I SAM-dependent methyltransferase n=1 Tax=Bacillaceae TaxID=186817 RepID=UPI00140B498E|nr:MULTISPECIES: methyltransferase domain-containing protein [Bacillaceae]MBO0962790.1 class I SAM-dependent methyltransferase [Neobacillus sp. MM2021_6]NHC19227.1 methyltransferase domain-containing protein [Bacillus sp. MM2020_4]
MNSKTKWNRKYHERINVLKEPVPNPRLRNLSSYLMGGQALDLACGLGGNSLFLAEMKYEVKAIDISEVAITYIKTLATNNKLNIHPSVSDLTSGDKYHWGDTIFDLVIITYYLDRSLFPIVKTIIKELGYFFMETFYQSPQNDNQGVSNQYKLHSQELLTEFGDWTILFFEENKQEGRQTIFCQKR